MRCDGASAPRRLRIRTAPTAARSNETRFYVFCCDRRVQSSLWSGHGAKFAVFSMYSLPFACLCERGGRAASAHCTSPIAPADAFATDEMCVNEYGVTPTKSCNDQCDQHAMHKNTCVGSQGSIACVLGLAQMQMEPDAKSSTLCSCLLRGGIIIIQLIYTASMKSVAVQRLVRLLRCCEAMQIVCISFRSGVFAQEAGQLHYTVMYPLIRRVCTLSTVCDDGDGQCGQCV